MPGLDYIPRYQTGGNVDTTDTTDTTESPLPVGKAVASKSKFALPTATGATGVDEGILQKMQELIAQREAQKGGFMESLKDAQAWWSGGMAGPGEALARRAKEREEFDATTFGMRRDLAQYRVAQEQARNLDKQLFGTGAPTMQPTAAQTTPGAVGAQPQAGEVITPTAAPNTGLLGLVKEPGLRQAIAVQAQSGDRAGAMKEIRSYLAKNATDPDIVKKVNYMLRMNMIDPKLVPQIMLTEAVGAGAFKPEDVRGPGGTMQTTPFGTAGTFVKQPAGAPPAPAMQRPGMAPPQVPAAPAQAAPAATAAPSATPTPTAGPQPIQRVQPLPRVGVPAAPAAPAAAPVTEAPLVPTNVATGFTPGSKEDLEAKAAVAKQAVETGAETQKPIAKQVGESIASTKSAASNAQNNIQEYDMAESILRKYPKAFGIGQDGSATAAVIQLIKPGTTIPILGTVKSENIEEFVAQKRLPPQAIAARRTFDAIATRQGVEFAKNNLTGEGRGTLSNADLKMAGVAKGLSIDNPAATNLIFTILNRENEQMILERGRLIERFEKESRERGVQPNYSALRESEAWKKTMQDKEERVKKRFPEFFKDETSAGSTGKKSPADFVRRKQP